MKYSFFIYSVFHFVLHVYLGQYERSLVLQRGHFEFHADTFSYRRPTGDRRFLGRRRYEQWRQYIIQVRFKICLRMNFVCI